jgi:membrane protease YdiL (CAAX protease family)
MAQQRKQASPSRNIWALLRAIISGLLIALVAANIWPPLLRFLGIRLAAFGEIIFLALFLWWTSGGGPPRTIRPARAKAFRRRSLSPIEMAWGISAALFLAIAINAAIVVLFRFVPYPLAAFRSGYDISFIPSAPLKWIVVVISAASAGICEETGFRGYMQQPIEQHYGAPIAVSVSAFFFMAAHLTKSWAMIGMVPIVFGAGVLLGVLAWSSRSLIPGIIGHVAMDTGLFAFWWTGIAGSFTERPITETGFDMPFFTACVALTISVFIVLLATSRLRHINEPRPLSGGEVPIPSGTRQIG